MISVEHCESSNPQYRGWRRRSGPAFVAVANSAGASSAAGGDSMHHSDCRGDRRRRRRPPQWGFDGDRLPDIRGDFLFDSRSAGVVDGDQTDNKRVKIRPLGRESILARDRRQSLNPGVAVNIPAIRRMKEIFSFRQPLRFPVPSSKGYGTGQGLLFRTVDSIWPRHENDRPLVPYRRFRNKLKQDNRARPRNWDTAQVSAEGYEWTAACSLDDAA